MYPADVTIHLVIIRLEKAPHWQRNLVRSNWGGAQN